MKKYILSFLLLALSVGVVGAQTFTTPKDTVNASFSNTMNVYNKITNVHSSDVTITWRVINHDFPADWINGLNICDNVLCYGNSAALAGGSTQTTAPITPGVEADFHLQMDLSAAGSGTHYLEVEMNDQANSYKKNVVFVLNKFPTNIGNVNKGGDDITVYPNPARSEINVLFGARTNVKNIAVYNMIGKAVSVYRVTGNSAKLNLDNIPAGVYFLRLTDAQGQIVATRKFTHQ